MRITYLYHLILVVLLVSLFISSDGAKKKKRKSKKNDRVNEADSADNSSEREKHSRIAGSELNSAGEPFSNNRGGDTLDPSLLTDDPSLQAEENELRVNLLRAIVNHGDDSLEKATALHVLGRNLYHQRKYSYVAEVSNEIVRIHEKIDGSESIQVALGLITSIPLKFTWCLISVKSSSFAIAGETIMEKFNKITAF